MNAPETPAPTVAAVLMDVLDRAESETFRNEMEAPRQDGIRPPMWELRYKMEHAKAFGPVPPSWLSELEHSLAHVMAAPSADALRGALVFHAALVAAWVRDLDGREG